jgi:excisionase family DNA binding protein
MDNQRLAWSPEEVAQLTGLHINSVYKYINSKQLKAVRLGKRWLVSKTELQRLLDGSKFQEAA